ncbi:MAG TPA: alpha-L-fucosidase, partial [Bacteroidales bacterium]|nr:alpha-L-fucosidase [Bacteroidales bacterium]
MKNTTFCLLLLLFLCNIQIAKSQKYEANWESIDKRPVPAWFTDAKFGIFIHWGVYSVPSWAPADAPIGVYAKYAEWYWSRLMDNNKNEFNYFRAFHDSLYGAGFRYQDFAPMFKAELFEPDKWADVFLRSGAKYIVLTSKHHEGFCLWPSAQSWNWNSVDIGPHRDLAGDLTKAVKAKGLHMGFYYSLYEWYNPLYKSDVDKYVDTHMFPQMKDLVTRYEPDVFWTDGEWDLPSDKWKSTQFLSWLYNESPVKNTVVVNDRWGKETRSKHGGIYTTEYDLVHDSKGIKEASHPWEECRGIGTSFGYNRVEDLDNYMTSKALVDLLVEKVAAGGNLLLDIGPTADGRIPVIMQQRLLDIGDWLKVNGEAIYGTQPWKDRPEKSLKDVYFTTKGNTLYV